VSAVPLFLLHGFTGSPASWDAVLARLPARAVLRPALLGHGAPPPEATTFDEEIARLAALLPPEPVHLAGYSLGARLALSLALAHPERLRRLTLIGVHPGLPTTKEKDARRQNDAGWRRLLTEAGIDAFVDAWEAQPLFVTQRRLPAAATAAHRAARLRHDPLGLARSLDVLGLAEMPDCRPRISALTMPVTLMAGELDEKFLGLGRELAQALPHATLRAAPGAGHDLLLERPDLVAVELNEKDERVKGKP
jgi:2-succinyl-6-hydroxy-2,4-cyclohexadiene-1-carboxylate synthase